MRQGLRVLVALALSCGLIGNSGASEIALAAPAADGRGSNYNVAAIAKAADDGNLKALVHMAELLEHGKIVEQDRVKACQMYVVVADRFATVDRYDPAAALVARAFRGAASCYAKGLDAPGWTRNMSAAADLLFTAGVILQDPESLFELARLYLSGDGIQQNSTMAIRFLESAARKRFPPAQALLGSMMWEGKLMKRNAASGLALLILGKERTTSGNEGWITILYEDAMITASKDVEQQALALVDKWRSVHGDQNRTLETVATVPSPDKSPARDLKELGVSNSTESYGNQTTRANVSPVTPEPESR